MVKEELWFTEIFQEDSGLTLRVRDVVETLQSPYQKIAVYETYKYKKLLTLDGAVMTTQEDEFFYHEMLVHPAAGVHSSIESIVIIGGGDGGTLREVLRYQEVKEASLVEIDREVTEVCRRHFSEFRGAFEDPRARLFFMDGFDFLAGLDSEVDLVIVDSTDPVGPAAKLFSEEFFKLVASKSKGMVSQFESPLHWGETEKEAFQALKRHFRYVHVYLGPVPTYPSGLWSYVYASNCCRMGDRIRGVPEGLKFYNSSIHKGICGELPPFAAQRLQ